MEKRTIYSFSFVVFLVSVFLQLSIAEHAVARKTTDSNLANNRNIEQPSNEAVIGHLQTRDKTLIIRSGISGSVYTVKSKDGRVLAVDLPVEKLFAEFPDLKKIVENGLAIKDASLRGIDSVFKMHR